jgi:hypothetical protein
MRIPFRWLAAAGLFGLMLTVPQPARAQAAHKSAGPELPPGDKQMLLTYRLSMDKLNRLVAATEKFRQLEKSNPKLAESLERQQEQDKNESLSAKIAKLEKVPQVRSTLASSGITARDYILSLLTVMNAGASVQIKKMGGDPSSLPVSAENVKFYQANQATIERMTKSLTQQEDSQSEGAENKDTTAADSE